MQANIASLASREPVLIVEDTRENQELLAGLCKKFGIPCEIAENGQVALEMRAKRSYPVYIVDLMMPVMDGKTFIGKLRVLEPEAIVLVQTALDASDTIIHVMKMGVFDYIIKPIDPGLFKDAIFKAIDYYYLKKFDKEQSLAAGLKIRNQIDWLSYKEGRRISGKDSTDNKSIYNLKTSLAQGAGFGSLVTLIDMLKANSAQEGDTYRVDAPIFDMLVENNECCRMQIDGLHVAADIMEQDIIMEAHRASDLVSALPEIFSNIIPFLPEKKLQLTYPELKDNCQLLYNEEKMKLIIEEILVNAFKYSVPGSTINVFSRISEGYFWLSMKNDFREKPYGGVPEKYEKLVLEPFFRLQPPDESAAKFERIGFGLGLSVADYVMKKQNGLCIVHDVKDLTHEKEKVCVLTELLLPLVETK